jgi:polygalacturonase
MKYIIHSILRKTALAVMMVFFMLDHASPNIIIYPAPPGLVTSPDFIVKVNDLPVWVEKIGSSLQTPAYSLYGGIEMEYLNVVNFSCSGPLAVTITASSAIDSYLIRPKSRGIEGKVNGRDLSFTIPGPQKLYIEINGLPHLAIFANPLEVNPPGPEDKGVIYFGPGTHSPGQITLRNDQIIYIAGGAIVNSNIRGKGLHHVKIMGRGILQGNVKISGTSGLSVEGIFIRNTKGWTNTLTNCKNSSYRNVKVFGYNDIYSVDGINPVSCKNFTIDDCFMRCRDDCVAIKSGDYKLSVDSIRVTNNVMIGWACSDGITIGFELNGGPVQNILVENCDILYARSVGRTGGHSGFSIVCDGPAWVQNIRFENIRVEENIEFKNLELVVTDGKLYGKDSPGHIRGIYLKNVHWENTIKPFIMSGYSADHLVEDIVFDHCSSGGKILANPGDALFEVNEFVRNLKFIP